MRVGRKTVYFEAAVTVEIKSGDVVGLRSPQPARTDLSKSSRYTKSMVPMQSVKSKEFYESSAS